jgi:hypothetical protein
MLQLRKLAAVAAVAVLAAALLLGVRVDAQGQTHPGTPPPGALCATPLAGASATPAEVVLASPGPGPGATPVGLYPCGPEASPAP